MNCNQ